VVAFFIKTCIDMRHLIFSFLLLGSLNLMAQRNGGLSVNNSTQIQEAKNFGLSVIQKYYDAQCPEVYNFLATEIIVFETGGRPVRKADISAQEFCAVNVFRTDLQENDFTIYSANFTQEVLDHTQFAQRFPNFSFQLQPGDFFFNGTIKTGPVEVFSASDMARFIIRRKGVNQFEIISI
jgi:hypothetical protein